MEKSLEELQNIELALWEQLRDQDWLDNVSNKFSELRWLLPRFSAHERKFRDAGAVLEMGAGEGWASCAVKRLHPRVRVTASDISEAAISGMGKWERIFESTVDSKVVCKSYSVPLADQSFGLIFSFQAAHHFGLQKETLKEAHRLLKPGGVCMYLNEPSCRKFIHPVAKWRVNRKRPECPEDLLVHEEMRRIAAEVGFTLEVAYSTSTLGRGVVEGVYYKGLSKLPALCSWLPCTADFIFTKS